MTYDRICKRLVLQQPFFGLFLMGVNVTHSDIIPTLGVHRYGIGIQLIINDGYWDSLTDAEQQAMLIHELYHIALNHIMMVYDFPDPTTFNYAADLEVNSYIDNLPEGVLLPKNYKLPDRQSTRWYYDNLPVNGNMCAFDDHSGWAEISGMSGAEKELARSQVESQMKAAANEVMKNRGTLPGGLTDMLKGLLKEKPRVYDWKAHLRRIVGTEIEVKFRKTYQRESKRCQGSPGLRMAKRARALVGVDTSGSISNSELEDFFSEISHMTKAGLAAHVVEFDAEITSEWDFKVPRDIRISGRGGTNFQPIVNYYRQHKKEYTVFVIFTDGCAPVDDLDIPGNNAIWIISSNGDRKDYPGKAIFIPPSQDN